MHQYRNASSEILTKPAGILKYRVLRPWGVRDRIPLRDGVVRSFDDWDVYSLWFFFSVIQENNLHDLLSNVYIFSVGNREKH